MYKPGAQEIMSCANSCKYYFCVIGSWSPALALNNHKVGFPPHETHFVTLTGQQWTKINFWNANSRREFEMVLKSVWEQKAKNFGKRFVEENTAWSEFSKALGKKIKNTVTPGVTWTSVFSALQGGACTLATSKSLSFGFPFHWAQTCLSPGRTAKEICSHVLNTTLPITRHFYLSPRTPEVFSHKTPISF